jgi:hypothetical protein
MINIPTSTFSPGQSSGFNACMTAFNARSFCITNAAENIIDKFHRWSSWCTLNEYIQCTNGRLIHESFVRRERNKYQADESRNSEVSSALYFNFGLEYYQHAPPPSACCRYCANDSIEQSWEPNRSSVCQEISRSHETGRFIAALTRARHPSLS